MRFFFACLLLLTAANATHAQNFDCSNYHRGYFQYAGEHKYTVIYRIANYQIEYNILNDKWMVLAVDWIDNCQYAITYVHTNRREIKPFLGYSLTTKILDGSETGYDYFAVFSMNGHEYSGRIEFLQWDLTAETKTKIENRLIKSIEKITK